MVRKRKYGYAKILAALPMLIGCVLLVWLLPACLSEEDLSVGVEKVLLVYIAGDNSLSKENDRKLDAIEQGYEKNDFYRILIYRDGQDDPAVLMELNEDGNLEVIENYEPENSADPQVLSRVIMKAKEMYPQASFNLLVFSHASGWLPGNSYRNPQLRSLITDGDEEMELSEFAGSIPDNSFNYIVFEASHMAGIEVVYQLKNKANFIAASSAEIISPGFTHTYAEHINDLVEGNPEEFMRQAFEYFNNQSGYLYSATFSIIQTSKLKALGDYVRAHCDLNKKVITADVQHFDRNTSFLFCDFGDYYTRLAKSKQEKQELQKLLNQCVVWKSATPYFMLGYNGYLIRSHSGLTGYIMQDRYPLLNTAYKLLNWYKAIAKP